MPNTGAWEQAVSVCEAASKALKAAIGVVNAPGSGPVKSAEGLIAMAREVFHESVENEIAVHGHMLKQIEADKAGDGPDPAQTAMELEKPVEVVAGLPSQRRVETPTPGPAEVDSGA